MNNLHRQLLQYNNVTKAQRRKIFSETLCCLICEGKSQRPRLVLDHCHQSGYVRGVLCERCNSWLGVTEGSRTQKIKDNHLKSIHSKYGIKPNLFKKYLEERLYLKKVDGLRDKQTHKQFIESNLDDLSWI